MSSSQTGSQAGSILVHGTAIAVGRRAVLIRGAPGAGKSDLALRCMAMPAVLGWSKLPARPIRLLADDQVELRKDGARLLATAPKAIAGKLEVRGIGLIDVDHIANAELALIVDLVDADQVERLPDPSITADVLGLALPRICLAPFEASAPLKLLVALESRAGR